MYDNNSSVSQAQFLYNSERSLLNIVNDLEDDNTYHLSNSYQIADDLNIFIREFSNTLSFISNRHHSAYICRDFNIDLLQ